MKDENKVISDEETTLSSRSKILKDIEMKEQNKEFQSRSRRLVFITGVLLVVIGVIFWVQTESIAELFLYGSFDPKDRDDVNTATNVRWVGSFFILISTSIFSYLYMVNFNPLRKNHNTTTEYSISDDKEDKLQIVSLLRSIDTSLEKGKLESILSEKERIEIITKISETVETQLNESLLTKIEEKYGQTIFNDKLSTFAADSLETTTERLTTYVDDLKSKASVNLAYGIGATIIAIMLLMYLLFNAIPPKESTNLNTVFFFVSRLFLVFLVQGIAIFFLGLYKSTLKNILYLSNEITNHESKRDSLTLSIKSGNTEATKSILLSLANTERNFLIKKGESSILSSTHDQANSSQFNESMFKELLNKFMTEK